VSDRCAIRAFGRRTLDVDVDPLMVVGGVGKCIYAFLIDGDPFGRGEFLTHDLNGLLDG
jgi:hypothetical protein